MHFLIIRKGVMGRFFVVAFLLFFSVFIRADVFAKPEPLVIGNVQKNALRLGMEALQQSHYSPVLRLDRFSNQVLRDYFHALDYERVYFLAEDVDYFYNQGLSLSEMVRQGDLSLVLEAFERYRSRASDLNDWILERLDMPFDFSSDAVLFWEKGVDWEAKNRPWRDDLEEVHAYQEKRLMDALIRLQMGGNSQEEAIRKLKSRYTMQQKHLNQMTFDDVFEVFFASLIRLYDPHSGYLSPRATEDFDIDMSLSLQGIGATLAYEDGRIVVKELIVGGPAYESAQLKPNDAILAVAQGEDGEFQDVVGMRLDRAVRLIRGKKGSVVRLLIEPATPGYPEREVRLVRDVVSLESQAAQGYVESLQAPDGSFYKLGVIRLPSFYVDFEGARRGDKDYRSTSRDLERILLEMKEEGVRGVVLDLRGDGGGSLAEAVRAVGLFIDRGPVVLMNNRRGDVSVERDTIPGAVYDGPLMVLIDGSSASASEIFAAAIQDYKRGLIVGSPSFGKGTVQTLLDLRDTFSMRGPDLGDLRMTIAMFYRVTGESIQVKGVMPDIELPNVFFPDEDGESAIAYALPWVDREGVPIRQSNDVNDQLIDALREKHQVRMREVESLLLFQEYIEALRERRKQEYWSLNLSKRQEEFENWRDYLREYQVLQSEAFPLLEADKKKKEQIEKRNLAVTNEEEKEIFVPDIGLYESLFILLDYIEMVEDVVPLPKAA